MGYSRDVLGISRLAPAQVEILEAIRDNRNTSTCSGHKCGKTEAYAIAAHWFVSLFDDARVVLTAVKADQIDKGIYRAIKQLHRRACTPIGQLKDDPRTVMIPIGGVLNESARSGLAFADGRQIFGITGRKGEALAGISGTNVFVIADEASGIDDPFFEALGTSLAGSGGTTRLAYASNPTRTEGAFYRSQTTDKSFKVLQYSSEDTPNARGEGTIPGLAGPEWIAERKLAWGEDSPQYIIRVKGRFVRDRDGKIVSVGLIAQAAAAWDYAPEEGAFQLGIDPAGDGIIGDETAIAVRRGPKIITVFAQRGLTEDAIVAHALGLIATYRRPSDPTPIIAIDAEGGIGTRVASKLRAHRDLHPNSFEVVPVHGGKKMWGSPDYDTVRDGLWGQCQKWLIAGGAIPEDIKLHADLNAPIFTADKNQRYVATEKKALRKLLGRSPDRGDAVCLATWKWESLIADDIATTSQADTSQPSPFGAGLVVRQYDDQGAAPTNPYEAIDAWQR